MGSTSPLTTDPGNQNLDNLSTDSDALITFETVAQNVGDSASLGPPNFSFPLPADFNKDSCVNFLDFLILQSNFGMTSGADFSDGDANNDGEVNFSDFLILQNFIGDCFVPEPSSLLIWVLLLVMAVGFQARRHSHAPV